MTNKQIKESITELIENTPMKLRYRLFPWFPRFIHIKELRMFEIIFGDHSVTSVYLTKTHFIALLKRNYRKWYQPKYIGIEIWY